MSHEDAPDMTLDGIDRPETVLGEYVGGSEPPRWMLDGEAPEPARFEDAKPADPDKADPSKTTTGTDPLGRAVGPNEDPTKIKKVRDEDGKVVTPKRDGTIPESASAKRRRERAERDSER